MFGDMDMVTWLPYVSSSSMLSVSEMVHGIWIIWCPNHDIDHVHLYGHGQHGRRRHVQTSKRSVKMSLKPIKNYIVYKHKIHQQFLIFQFFKVPYTIIKNPNKTSNIKIIKTLKLQKITKKLTFSIKIL